MLPNLTPGVMQNHQVTYLRLMHQWEIKLADWESMFVQRSEHVVMQIEAGGQNVTPVP